MIIMTSYIKRTVSLLYLLVVWLALVNAEDESDAPINNSPIEAKSGYVTGFDVYGRLEIRPTQNNYGSEAGYWQTHQQSGYGNPYPAQPVNSYEPTAYGSPSQGYSNQAPQGYAQPSYSAQPSYGGYQPPSYGNSAQSYQHSGPIAGIVYPQPSYPPSNPHSSSSGHHGYSNDDDKHDDDDDSDEHDDDESEEKGYASKPKGHKRHKKKIIFKPKVIIVKKLIPLSTTTSNTNTIG